MTAINRAIIAGEIGLWCARQMHDRKKKKTEEEFVRERGTIRKQNRNITVP